MNSSNHTTGSSASAGLQARELAGLLVRNEILRAGRGNGDKMPATRVLVDAYETSMGTVTRAIGELVEKGVLATSGRRGVYVKDITRSVSYFARSKSVAVVISSLTNFYAAIITAFEARLAEEGYHVIVCDVSCGNASFEERVAEALHYHTVSALLLHPQGFFYEDKGVLAEAVRMRVPTLLIDADVTDVPADTLLIDNVYGAQVATTFLLDHGHRNIAFLALEMGGKRAVEIEREKGYRKALERYTVPVNEELFLRVDMNMAFADAAAHMKDVILREQVTAMICYHDALAYWLIKHLELAGVRVPDDLSVIGFDNTPREGVATLTTIDPGKARVGRKAAEIILSRLSAPFKAKQTRTMIKPKCIEGETTKTLHLSKTGKNALIEELL